MVLCMYKSQVYDSLGDVEQVAKLVDQDRIKGAGKIILKYGFEKDVCIVLAHRHFKLAKTEAMLERSEGVAWISKPVELDQLKLFGAVPNQLVCVEPNKWYPVGYGVGDENALHVWNDARFLEEMGTYLIENELQNKLMLGARCAKEEKNDGIVFMEYNYEETRTSETRPCAESKFKNGLQTTFSFALNENGEVEQFCRRACQPIGEHTHAYIHVG